MVDILKIMCDNKFLSSETGTVLYMVYVVILKITRFGCCTHNCNLNVI